MNKNSINSQISSAAWTSILPPALLEAAREEDSYLQASAGHYDPQSGPTTGVGNLTKVSGTFVPSCDVETQNRGWKYLLTILATLVRII